MTLLTPGSVAKRLRISVSRVQQLDREGVLRALKDSGGRRLYDPDLVEQYARQREQRYGLVEASA